LSIIKEKKSGARVRKGNANERCLQMPDAAAPTWFHVDLRTQHTQQSMNTSDPNKKAASHKSDKTPHHAHLHHEKQLRGEELRRIDCRPHQSANLLLGSDGRHRSSSLFFTLSQFHHILNSQYPTKNNHEPKQAAVSHHGNISCGRSRSSSASWHGW
jgi:hypothetical protein